MRLSRILPVALLLVPLSVGAVFAQGSQVELTGTVTQVDRDAPATTLTLAVNGTTFLVELGPVWALEGFPLDAGSTVTVSGERVGENTIVAFCLTWKDADGNAVTLTLRDQNGNPTWSGTPGPKESNRYRNESRVQLQNAQGEGYRHESGPQDGTGNRWQGEGRRHESGPQDGTGNQWGRRR